MTIPSVSRETKDKFDAYLALLAKWQKTINLVGAETLPEAWERHILDSLQLVSLIPAEAKTLHDWGSGGGFPGLVIAMARPDLKVTLVEADQRKCAFLRTVSRETKSPVTILDERIESLQPAILPPPDVITARALAALPRLLEWALPWVAVDPAPVLLFLKGENAEAEITQAKEKYKFSLTQHASQTAAGSSILEIRDLCIT